LLNEDEDEDGGVEAVWEAQTGEKVKVGGRTTPAGFSRGTSLDGAASLKKTASSLSMAEASRNGVTSPALARGKKLPIPRSLSGGFASPLRGKHDTADHQASLIANKRKQDSRNNDARREADKEAKAAADLAWTKKNEEKRGVEARDVSTHAEAALTKKRADAAQGRGNGRRG